MPALPGAHFGQGLKVSASEATHFEKEVDLAFPVPAGAPANPKDAFYHVYRKLQGPNGAVLFESVDDAFVEGEGASAKIVTASFPMYGYRHGFNAFDAQHRLQVSAFDAGVPGTMMTAHMVVLWTHNALLPGAPVPGKITGRVIRPTFAPGSPTPVFEGVAGLIVQRDDVNDPNATVAVTQADGRFTFDDPHFTTGASTIRTTYNGQTYTATTFAVARTDSKVATDPALGALVAQGHFTNLATANITLPAAEAPPPAPQVTIRVMRLEDGVRKATDGIVLAGTPLVIGFATEGTINSATIQGEAHAVQRDPLQGQKSALGMDAIVEYTANTPGSYTISVTALPPFGPPVTATGSFRVIAAGSSQLTSVPGRPGVILARTVPKANATGVPVTIFPQVTFTEPVTQISSASVQLIGPDGVVPVKLLAVAVDGAGNPYPIDDLQDPNAVISSLTLQPTIGLQFGKSYRLVLTDAILDRDTPTPQALTPFDSSFTTFAPEDLGSTEETPRGAGLVVLGDRAYLAETLYPGGIGNPALQTGQLRTYDVSDPVTPAEVPPAVNIGYAPRDLAGEDRGGQRTLAVATGPKAYFFVEGEFIFTNTIRSSPATLFVYDATSDPPRWVGAATLTSSLEDGVPNRVVMKDGLAYVATVGKGVQVVDLAQARVGFAPDGYAPDATAPELFALRSQLFNGGINHTAVVATVPVVAPGAEFSYPLADLKVADLTVEETGRRLVLATGPRPAVGLVVLDPLSGEKLWRSELLKDGQRLDAGSAVAVATLGGRPVALVGGTGIANGTSTGVLFVVDLSPLARSPRQVPSIMSVLALPHQVGDILIKDSTAIVSASAGAHAGAATLVDLTELMAPRIVGSLSGIGSRMASGNQVLFTTDRSFLTGAPTALGGVQTMALGSIAIIRQVTPIIAALDEAGRTLEPIEVKYQLIAPPVDLGQGAVRLLRNSQSLAVYPVQELGNGTFTMTVPAGVFLETPPESLDISIRKPDGTLTSPFKTSIRNPDPDVRVGVVGNGSPNDLAVLTSLEPSLAVRGSAPRLVTARGSNLAGISTIHVRGLDGEWLPIDTLSRSANEITFNLTPEVLSRDGFVQVSAAQDVTTALAFLVHLPGFPPPGSASTFSLQSASPVEVDVRSETLHLTGENFVEGLKVVLGRGAQTGVVLATTFLSDTDIEAELPTQFIGQADDLFVSVLSADGQSMAQPIGVRATAPGPIDLASQFEENEVGVAGVKGQVFWNGDEQELEIEGANLQVGMEVVFTAHRGDEVRTATALLRPRSFKVTVPRALTDYPTFSFQFEGTTPGQTPFTSPPSFVVPQEPFEVPFGGQAKVVVQRDTLASKLYLLQDRPLGRGLARPTAGSILRRRLIPDRVATLSVIENPIDARGIPTVQVEVEAREPDPNAFYLRGLRLSRDPDTGIRSGPVTVKAVSGPHSATIRVGVVERALGQTNGGRDSDIVKVANRYGVPPQFLKAQVEHESSFRSRSFRYEPWTVDLMHLSGDSSIRDRNGNSQVFNGSARWLQLYPFDKYMIGGQVHSAPRPITPLSFSRVACVPLAEPPSCAASTQTVFAVHPGSLYGRSGLPSQSRASRVRAVITGSDRRLTAEPTFEGMRWSRSMGTYAGRDGSLGPSDWTVDYVNGVVRLYQALAPGETLTVSYEPVATAGIVTGTFGNPAPEVFDLERVNGVVNLSYARGEPIGTWFQRNLDQQIARGRPRGNFFGNASESLTEFDEATKLPVDTRLHMATAQFYAASSYGPLQLTLLPWTDSGKKEAFDTVLRVEDVPLYQLASGWEQAWDRGLSLGAAFHRTMATNLLGSGQIQLCNPCNAAKWEQYWARIFSEYNSRGPNYRIDGGMRSAVIRSGRQYEPF
ncbi:MAG TPA: Ig-like domain-containing protein [Vicinamibacterales bacterium]|nr:Ig-like domain-containing protein [Vicinamibacterales bacterium]